MVVRKRRKKHKQRGNRTHGAGGTKNRRGSGNRGGVGRGGSHKHKFSTMYLDFGIKRTLKTKAKKTVVNLDYISDNISRWEKSGKVKKENGLVIVDGKALGFGKVLGRGNIKEKIKLENASASKSAVQKIIDAGGSSLGDEEFEQEGESEEQ